MCIWGPPGSGKSPLARTLASALKNGRNIVIDAMSLDLSSLVRKDGLFEQKALFDLLQPLAYERLAPIDQSFGQGPAAFKDAWNYMLAKRERSIWLLVEDLYSQAELKTNLDRLRKLAHRSNLRLLVVNRLRLQGVRELDEQFCEFECKLWNRQEAQTLLQLWVDNPNDNIPAIGIRQDWLQSQESFSSYTLEIIVHNLRSLDFSNNDQLLRQAIRSYTDQIATVLTDANGLNELLNNIRGMLESGASRENILAILSKPIVQDPVLVLGRIAWHSQFEQGSPTFGSRKLTQWFPGSTLLSANELLEEGLNAGVFKQETNSTYGWANMLVRDGCAALYLRQQFQSLENQTIAGMALQLHDAGSVAILSLAFDALMLASTVYALLNRPEELRSILDNLLSGQTLRQLAKTPQLLWNIGNQLFLAGKEAERRLDESLQEAPDAETRNKRVREGFDMCASLGKAAARIMNYYAHFDEFLRPKLVRHDFEGCIAVGSFIANGPRDQKIIDALRGSSAGYCLQMVARLCSPDELDLFMTYAVQSIAEGMGIMGAAEVCFDRFEKEQLLKAVRTILHKGRLETYLKNENDLVQLLCVLLRVLLTREASDAPVLVPFLGSTCLYQFEQGSELLAEELAEAGAL